MGVAAAFGSVVAAVAVVVTLTCTDWIGDTEWSRCEVETSQRIVLGLVHSKAPLAFELFEEDTAACCVAVRRTACRTAVGTLRAEDMLVEGMRVVGSPR